MPPTDLNVLSAMITPAVLISACGTLILSTSNRLSRAVDRLRRSSERILALARDEGEDARLERGFYDELMPKVMRRIRLIHRALVAFYLSVGLFVLCSLFIGFDGVVALDLSSIPIILGLGGALVLCYGTALLTLEAQLSLNVNLLEMRFLRQISHEKALE